MPTNCAFGGGSTLAAVVYNQQFIAYNSVFDTTFGMNYVADGSGKGQAGFLNNDPSQHGYAGGTTIAFGGSDATLSSAQINVWNSSQGAPGCVPSTLVGCAAVGAGTGKAQAGPLIQLPTFGTTITIPFKLTGQRTNGTIQLNDNLLCGIFSGKINTWNDPAMAGINTRGAAPTGPINVIYRSDGSGTTFLTTQHLAAVCNSGNSNITFTANASFASEFGGTPPSNFTGGNGSGGVKTAITSTANSIGYLSPDYTQIAPVNAGLGSFPPVAAVKNSHDTKFYLPTASNGDISLKNAPGPSNPADPTQYVPPIPDPTAGYPIVGFTTIDLPQCYANNTLALGLNGDGTGGIVAFLTNFYSAPALLNLLTQNGFSTLPPPLLSAISGNILQAGSTAPLLDIQDPTVCQAAGASGPGTFAGR